MKESHDLGLMIDSRIPLIVIETYDEKRALDILLNVANLRRKSIFQWSVTEGLSKMSFGPSVTGAAKHTEPKELLKVIRDTASPAIYVLCDFHPYLEGEPQIVRQLKDIALDHNSVPNTIIFLSYQLKLPPELSRYAAVAKMSLPSDEEIMGIIRDEARDYANSRSGRVKTDSETIKKLVANLKGLSHEEVRRLARSAIVDDGAITEEDIPEVNKAKFELMDMEGVLSFEYNTEKFSNVGGLQHLRKWLLDRHAVFVDADEKASDVPRGILLVGVQGGGKSLAAKSIAGLWGLPLLKLDFGALFNKFYGETERNLREALNLAEVMSPCVLWVDEIEKGLSSDMQDSGTSQRVLGTLLTWMAEHRKKVFIVATSNDISRLPPELVRKGRMDEIFFVDLPDAVTRADIFKIHLQKRDVNADAFNLDLLAAEAEGFSGAEIEQAVVASLYGCAARNESLNEHHVLHEIQNTSPLSIVMAEKIAKLRAWANGRTVSAN